MVPESSRTFWSPRSPGISRFFVSGPAPSCSRCGPESGRIVRVVPSSDLPVAPHEGVPPTGQEAATGPGRLPEPRAASPYVDLDRAAWSKLSESTPLPLTDADVIKLRGLGDPIDLAEV